MNPDHSRYAQWDAAYVLGALSATERREFEEHLADCADCRQSLADLTPTVALLSRIAPQERSETPQPDPATPAGPSPQLRSGLIHRGRASVRRRRRMRMLTGVLAAVLVLAAVVVPLAINATRPQAVELSAIGDIPLEASVTLTTVTWGTKIDLDCRYLDTHDIDVPPDGWTYSLAVIDRLGRSEAVSSWQARPGGTAAVTAGTALNEQDISAIEIRSAKGDLLMELTLDR